MSLNNCVLAMHLCLSKMLCDFRKVFIDIYTFSRGKVVSQSHFNVVNRIEFMYQYYDINL